MYFCSYAHDDNDRVELIITSLLESGYQLNVDRSDIRAGDLWEDEIHKMIKNSDGAIVFLTKAWFSSKFIQKKEWPWMQQEFYGERCLFPVLLDDMKLPSDIACYQYVDATHGNIKQIVKDINIHLPKFNSKLDQLLLKYIKNTVKSIESNFSDEGMTNPHQMVLEPKLRIKTNYGLEIYENGIDDNTSYTIEQAVDKFARIIILGDPGMGKTTALRYICLNYSKRALASFQQNALKNNILLPVWVELRRYRDYQSTHIESIFALIQESLSDMLGEIFKLTEELFKNYAVLLILDGLNEIMTRESRENCIQGIKDICESFNNRTKCIISSRKHNFELEDFKHENNFKPLELSELTDNDIREFIQCYQLSSNDTNLFVEQLDRDLKLRRLAQNPMLLSILAKLFKKGAVHQMPRSRAKILIEFLLGNPNGLLRRNINSFSRSLNVDANTALELKKWFCKQIAYKMQTYGLIIPFSRLKQDFESQKFPSWVNTALKSIEEVLVELKNNSIMEPSSDEKDGEINWEFRHQLFHEFFVACQIADEWRNNAFDKIRHHIHDIEWHESIALAAGMIESNEHL